MDPLFELKQAYRQLPHEYLVMTKKEFAKVVRFAKARKKDGVLVPRDHWFGGGETLRQLIDTLLAGKVYAFGKPSFF